MPKLYAEILKHGILHKITVNLSSTQISRMAYMGLGFTKVIIPKGIKKIGDMAFKDCMFLKELEINEPNLEIGYFAFSGCPLEKVILPLGTKIYPTSFDKNVKISYLKK